MLMGMAVTVQWGMFMENAGQRDVEKEYSLLGARPG